MIDVEPEDRQLTTYDHAIEFESLYKGLKKSCLGVRWKDAVVGYEGNALKNTYLLRQSLLNDTYKLDKYQVFHITEPKPRVIVATRIKDRQLQHALSDNGFIQEITKGFIYDNCACQVGKGIRFAGERFKEHLRRFYRKHGCDGWVLKCDIAHFFASVDHDVAKKAARKRLSSAEMIRRVDEIIDSYGPIGLGLGSQISQYLALAILDDLDHFIKEKLRIKCYIRYMDDFILIHESKEYLRFCRIEIERFLNTLKLTTNEKTVLFPLSQGVVFLKWKYKLTQTGKVKVYMTKPKLTRSRSHFKKLARMERAGLIASGKTKQCLASWIMNARYGCTETICKNMIKYVEGQLWT